MLLRGQCQALFSDTWLVLCWHWVCHVPRACHGSRETRGLSNIRGISWCHHDRDWGGWLGSEEALTTIRMSRVYIGDQDSAIIRESRRRGVLSPRHSNTSSSLRSIINIKTCHCTHNQSWSTELWTQHRDWIIQMSPSQYLQFEPPQWEFNFHNYQAKLDFHWWAVSESWCQVSGGEHHQPGNSPIWDNTFVKITVQIVSNPYFSRAHFPALLINLPPYTEAGKCVVWSK